MTHLKWNCFRRNKTTSCDNPFGVFLYIVQRPQANKTAKFIPHVDILTYILVGVRKPDYINFLLCNRSLCVNNKTSVSGQVKIRAREKMLISLLSLFMHDDYKIPTACSHLIVPVIILAVYGAFKGTFTVGPVCVNEKLNDFSWRFWAKALWILVCQDLSIEKLFFCGVRDKLNYSQRLYFLPLD